jgi:hypothetical protein
MDNMKSIETATRVLLTLLGTMWIVAAWNTLTTLVQASPVGGTIRSHGVLAPGGDTDELAFFLRSLERASIRVDGDGDGDIDCYLQNESGAVVASDTDSTDTCVLSVIPRWTGLFTLLIQNNGDRADAYRVVIR